MSESSHTDRRRKGIVNRFRRRLIFDRSRAPESFGDPRKPGIDPDIVMIALGLSVVLMGFLVALTLWQQSELNRQQTLIEISQASIRANQKLIREQQEDLARLEKRDRINAYQTAYRFCARNDVDRAAAHWILADQLPHLTSRGNRARLRRISKMYLKRLESKQGLPILDCTPNITGDPAAYQSSSKQREFVDRWRKKRLTMAEIGICRIRIGDMGRAGDCD